MSERTTTSFDVEDELDVIHYNFKPYVDAEGEIPEPSDTEIENFRKTMLKLFNPVVSKAGGNLTEENLREIATKLNDSELEETSHIQDKLLRAIAKLCSNQPSYVQLKKLPWRGQKKFIGWIMGIYLDPKH